jgi:hypothetical protein
MTDAIATDPRILVACGIAGTTLPPSMHSGSCEILVLPVPVDLTDKLLSAQVSLRDTDAMEVHDYRNVPRDAVRQAVLAVTRKPVGRQMAQTVVVRCNKAQLEVVMDACLWSLESQSPPPSRRFASAKIAYFSALLGWYAPSLRDIVRRLFWLLRRIK